MHWMGWFHDARAAQSRGILDAPFAQLGDCALAADDIAVDGGAMACLSGTIRNDKEIVAALHAAGIRIPHDGTPASIVLGAYRRWGMAYPEHLHGELSTAVIDETRGKFVVSRDRMGVKPLFYAASGTTVRFSDHPDTLLRTGQVARVIDREGMCELFGLGPARSMGRTPWRDIREIPPGYQLQADKSGIRLTRYFALAAHPHTDDAPTTVARVRALLEASIDAIRPLYPGAMLSGGLDSTVITALYARDASWPVSSFSVDYEENDRHFTGTALQPEEDAAYARMAAQVIGCRHTAITLSQTALAQALDEAVMARGFPGMGDIDASMLLFARRIAPHCGIVLSGECADEVFGGYPWFQTEPTAIDAFPWSDSLELRESLLLPSVREKLNLRGYTRDRLHESLEALPTCTEDSPKDAYLRALQGLCFSYFMANLQERATRMCEWVGVRVLTPYIDESLVQYVYNVPWAMKRMDGQVKGLLRAAVKDLLPDELRLRRKSPYPKTYHPAYAEQVARQLMKRLDDPHEPLTQWVDRSAIAHLMADGMPPTARTWFGQLMTMPQMIAYLLQVNEWMRVNRAEVEL